MSIWQNLPSCFLKLQKWSLCSLVTKPIGPFVIKTCQIQYYPIPLAQFHKPAHLIKLPHPVFNLTQSTSQTHPLPLPLVLLHHCYTPHPPSSSHALSPQLTQTSKPIKCTHQLLQVTPTAKVSFSRQNAFEG